MEKSEQTHSYFSNACSWIDDYHSSLISSRNRYQYAFFVSAILSVALVFSLIVLLPLQKTQLVIVHEGPTGYEWITTAKPQQPINPTWLRTKAEIAHYIETREAYDPDLYFYQYHEVQLLSSTTVFSAYESSQISSNKTAAINLLGTKGYRTVIIKTILPLNHAPNSTDKNSQQSHFAQVDFVVIDHLLDTTNVVKTPYSVLVGWRYVGIPTDPYQRLHNWDGFQITQYSIQPVYIR